MVDLKDLLAPDGVTDPRYLAARNRFWEYCRLRDPRFFRESREYLRDLADTLQALCEGRLMSPKTGEPYTKLIMNLPPRHGKSYILTMFCQWLLGKCNENRIISVSYNEILAGRFARNVRDGIDATKLDDKRTIFSDIFPATRIKQGDASMQLWSLEGQFFNYLAAGFGGTITGVGCNIGIIDDPIKNDKEAFNDRVLEEQWSWYTDTFLSRIEEGGLQIVNMTRWSTKDLCGRLLSSDDGDEWYVFCRQAYDEATGMMLCEELLSKKSYLKKRRLTSAAIADANFQQQPVDIQGRLYSSFATYQDLPRKADGTLAFERIISYTDTADTGKDKLMSMVAGVLEGRGYALDVIYTDKPMEVTEPLVAAQLHTNRVNLAKIESNNGGRGFARSVERHLWEDHHDRTVAIEWFHQGENKQARILAGASFVMRNLLMPEDWATRWPEYYRDMNTYQANGKNAHDDAPDGTTGIVEMIQAEAGQGDFIVY